jgi:hypothetical protein
MRSQVYIQVLAQGYQFQMHAATVYELQQQQYWVHAISLHALG